MKIDEYQCPNCLAYDTLWPAWDGRKRYYKCAKCGSNYGGKQLDKIWGRKDNVNPLSIVKE